MRSQNTTHPGASNILGLLNEFEHRGPNGDHMCLLYPKPWAQTCQSTGAFSVNRGSPYPSRGIFRSTFCFLCRISMMMPGHLHWSVFQRGSISKRQLPLYRTSLARFLDIRPSNILLETSALNEIFSKAPPDVFEPDTSPLVPRSDFYIESTEVSCVEEDLAGSINLQVRSGRLWHWLVPNVRVVSSSLTSCR